MKNIIKEILADYLGFIKRYKEQIKLFKLDEESIYGTSGVLGDYKFQYHGAGCRLEKDGVICEYDFLPENGYPIKFSNWEIAEFINTNKKWTNVKYSLEELHEVLLQLVEEKKLFLLEIGGMTFPIFQVRDMDGFKG